MNILAKLASLGLLAVSAICTAQETRWSIPDGEGISWSPKAGQIPHYDHIEMSGEQISTVLRWGIEPDGSFTLDRSLVFPMLRTVPNNTHASLTRHISTDIAALPVIDGMNLCSEKVEKVSLNGALKVESTWKYGYKGRERGDLRMSRTIFPSRTLPAICEIYEITNLGNNVLTIEIPELMQEIATDPARGVTGQYRIRAELAGSGSFRTAAGESVTFAVTYQGYRDGEAPAIISADDEYAARMDFIHTSIDSNLILETPDNVIDTEFRFAKIRASESIYRTAGGLMHGPGGESYYAALWANDQAEYVNPFFPFLGYDIGNESAVNSFRYFARFMNDDYKPIPSSIIAEGIDIWNGAGDRGDAAMIASGASRFALTLGDRTEAENLWPLISWCLEYSHRKLNDQGVPESDSDELEGRFPAGKANLSTACLYYDGLVSSACLAAQLGRPQKEINEYKTRAKNLAQAIEKYFGADVNGYHTYRYYDGNEVLRSWICLPLIMGLKERTEGTVNALLGPELMTEDGLLTAQGSTTFWDRSTLYALRGIYIAGQEDRATEFLHHYSARRLLGDHVPYPIEAWPEGSQRHLSAESGLYCRIITEGMFGIRPTGLRSFSLSPRLPSGWDYMKLKHIRAFDSDFDICVERLNDGKLQIIVCNEGKEKTYKIKPEQSIKITL